MKIIDFHTHTFPDAIAEKTVIALSHASKTTPFLTAKLKELSLDNQRCGIDLSVSLPVVTNPLKTEKINDASAEINKYTEQTGVLSFAGIHPDTPNAKEEVSRIASMGFKGIKVHPVYQRVALNDIRFKRIAEYAEDNGLILLSHGGLDIGVEGDLSSPKQCLELLKEVQPTKFVMAHMGGWNQWDDVEEYLCGENLYFDTAFCYGNYAYQEEVTEDKRSIPLSTERICTLIQKHGADKILFGTDSPWTERKNQVELFSALPLSQEEKEKIFCQNAQKLLSISL